MAFDPREAYDSDWQWMDCVEDATFTPKDPAQTGVTSYDVKVSEFGGDTDELPNGQRVSLSPTETALYFWKAGSSAPDPTTGDVLSYSGVDYSVKRATFDGQEPFVVTVQPQVANS